MDKKRSFWEKLTGSVHTREDYEDSRRAPTSTQKGSKEKKEDEWIEEENDEAELAVDVYQTSSEIVVQTFVAGVRPEDLELSITRDMVTIRGHREESRSIDEENYFSKELYWGKFSRVISLPSEVEPEEVEATEKHGLLTVKIKKVDKEKKSSVRIKSI